MIGFGLYLANKIISRLKEEYRKAEGDKALNRVREKKLSKNGALKEHVPEGYHRKGNRQLPGKVVKMLQPGAGRQYCGVYNQGKGRFRSQERLS